MPANVVALDNAKSHFTNAEKSARKKAEEEVTRHSVRLTPPRYLKEDLVAYDYWRKTIKRMRGISLLDDVDTDMLATYCQMLSRKDSLVHKYNLDPDDNDSLKNLQAQERMIIQYADKLGLTPSGRARLAKKRAEERQVDPNADMFGAD